VTFGDLFGSLNLGKSIWKVSGTFAVNQELDHGARPSASYGQTSTSALATSRLPEEAKDIFVLLHQNLKSQALQSVGDYS
jgi:hypothetical protein